MSFTFHFWHVSFIFYDVKLAELSNNSFEWKYVTFCRVEGPFLFLFTYLLILGGGSKHTLTPPAYFQGVRTPSTLMIYARTFVRSRNEPYLPLPTQVCSWYSFTELMQPTLAMLTAWMGDSCVSPRCIAAVERFWRTEAWPTRRELLSYRENWRPPCCWERRLTASSKRSESSHTTP